MIRQEKYQCYCGSHTTRAVFIERHGPPEVLVEREVPFPDPGPGEVHLRVEAAGVNFADLLMRAGLYSTAPPLPYSPGFEVAGRATASCRRLLAPLGRLVFYGMSEARLAAGGPHLAAHSALPPPFSGAR